MRITSFEKEEIIRIAKQVFGENTKAYLFGSRVDDERRGGDIDIFLEIENQDGLFKKKSRFSLDLQDSIGEQKIDLIISLDDKDVIIGEARRTGVLLG